MWQCEVKLQRKAAHFQLPSVAQKRHLLKHRTKEHRRRRQKEVKNKFAFLNSEKRSFWKVYNQLFSFLYIDVDGSY